MNHKCNLIILESHKGYSDKIRDYLQTRGVSSHVVADPTELSLKLRSLVMPVILCELPSKPDLAKHFISDFLKIPYIENFPLICVGDNAQIYEQEFDQILKLSVCLNKPVNNSELHDTISYITDKFEFPKNPVSQGNQHLSADDFGISGKTLPDDPQGNAETRLIEANSAIPAADIYSSFNSIPNLFFNELNKYNLLSKSFNGKKYATFTVKQSLIQQYFFTDPKFLSVFEELAYKLPEYLDTKIHRVAFLSNQIIRQIIEDKDLIEKSKVAAVLFNWSLINEQKAYLKKDYLNLKSKTFRRDLCSKIKDSAMKCALDLGEREIAEMISKIGKYIGLEEIVGNDPHSIIASTIAAVDMIDRACWQNNHFNYSAAYKLMAKAKSGLLSEFHPLVLCCIIKVLSEALASTIKIFMIPKNIRKDPKLFDEALKKRKQVAQPGEKKVEINELTPGMRLSRPLIAFDGKEILEQNMVLDQDLIWRIWQLSLVRPLNAPLVIDK